MPLPTAAPAENVNYRGTRPDGTPFQTGDHVCYPAEWSLVWGEVITASPFQIFAAPDCTSAAHFNVGQWRARDFILRSTPAQRLAWALEPPAPLPSRVPGTRPDGSPFRRGDWLWHLPDGFPPAGIDDGLHPRLFRVVTPTAPNGMLHYRPAATALGRNQHTALEFALFREVSPADPPLLPDPSDGWEGATPDLEFAEACAEYVRQPATMQERQERQQAIKATFGLHGTAYLYELDPEADEQAYRQAYVSALLNRARDYTRAVYCHTCALTYKALEAHNAPGCAARHFNCASCGEMRGPTAACAEHTGNGKICTLCCVHTPCACGCGEIVTRTTKCPQCNRSTKHCKCEGCELPACRAQPAKECCGHCAVHCECGHSCFRHTQPAHTGNTHGLRALHKFFAPKEEKGMTRLLGTEIETAGAKRYSKLLRDAVAKWEASVIGDSSIGGKGVELVTQPAGGSQWVEMISDLGKGFAESEAKTANSCGLHVHVNSADLDPLGMARLIRLYAHIEPTLYDAITAERATNSYSVPNGKQLLAQLDLVGKNISEDSFTIAQYGGSPPRLGARSYDENGRQVVVTETTIATITKRVARGYQQLKKDKYQHTRYVGLNLHSHWFRGTVEFRHHHGTNDPEKIMNWGLFVGGIVDFAVTRTEDELAKVLKMGPREAVKKAMGYPVSVTNWLQRRWDLFTSGPGARISPTPRRDTKTGEV